MLGLRINKLGAAIRNGYRPSLAFKFSDTTRAFDGRITYTGASARTYHDSTGTIQTASSGTPRANANADFNPTTLAVRGFLIEEARTNLLLQNSVFGTTWSAVGTGPATVTSNSLAAPNGATEADTITGVGNKSDRVQQTVTLLASTTYCLSFYVKNNTAVKSQFHCSNLNSGVTNSECYINWSGATLSSFTNTGTTVGVSVQYPNGWYRVYFFFTTNASDAGTATVRFYPNGDSASAASQAVYLWGAQLEVGKDPSAVIATTTGTVARVADVANVTSTNFSSIFNTAEGALFVRAASYDTSSSQTRAISVSDNTTNNYIDISRIGSSAQARSQATVGGVSQVNALTSSWPVNTFYKAIASYKLNDYAACLNGGTVATDVVATVPTVDRLQIGHVAGGNQLNGWVSEVGIFRWRIPNATEQALTLA